MNITQYLKNSLRKREQMPVTDDVLKVISSECKYHFQNDSKAFYSPFLRWHLTLDIKKDHIVKLKSHLDNRRPKDTDTEKHNFLNSLFLEKFGWKVRNGVFASRVPITYTRQYIFLPIGEYRFAYSPLVKDLFFDMTDRRTYQYLGDEKMKYLVDSYIENNIEKSGAYEVSFNCKEYYMINMTGPEFSLLKDKILN